MKDKFPKKAKLITNAGFYRIVDLPSRVSSIHFPVLKRFTIQIADNFIDENMHFEIVFEFRGVKKGYAEYHQINFIKTPEDEMKELSNAVAGTKSKLKNN